MTAKPRAGISRDIDCTVGRYLEEIPGEAVGVLLVGSSKSWGKGSGGFGR